eukprot:bmy_16808T0
MITVLAITASQKNADGTSEKLWHHDHGEAQNIILASIGASKAVVLDLLCSVQKAAKYDDIKKVVKQALEEPLKDILGYTED